MNEMLNFDYYYGIEAEQFSFYRVPRLLIKDERFKGLSSDAKLLYGLMLDRMSLSMKNGWFDEQDRAYIHYTIENIMEDLGCGKDKGVKTLAELDNKKGIGLIEKKRQGLGKPDIIYVKNFASLEPRKDSFEKEKQSANPDVFTEVGKTEFKKSEKPNSRSLEKPNSRSLENRIQEVGKTDSNYTNINYTDNNYIDNHIYHINQDIIHNHPDEVLNPGNSIDLMDGFTEIQKREIYYEIISSNIAFDDLQVCHPYEQEMVTEIFELMVDTVCSTKESQRIAKEDIPQQIVKNRFLKLRYEHIEYILLCLKNNPSQIRNIKAYLLSCLYNAPATIDSYYRTQVNYVLSKGSDLQQE